VHGVQFHRGTDYMYLCNYFLHVRVTNLDDVIRMVALFEDPISTEGNILDALEEARRIYFTREVLERTKFDMCLHALINSHPSDAIQSKAQRFDTLRIIQICF